MTYRSSPPRQKSWDVRAAANFTCGGAGTGLIVFAALAGEHGEFLALPIIAGLALVATGLLAVWHETGRPLRALHVFFHPQTSWMSREAYVATLLFPAGLLAAAGVPGLAWLSAALALAFVYCQARMLRASTGIPAWREPRIVPLIVATGLAEGGGLLLAASPWLHVDTAPLLEAFAALLLLRGVLWWVYRRALAGTAAPRALAALDGSGAILYVAGTLLPLALTGIAAASAPGSAGGAFAAVVAGLAAAAAGAQMKYTLVVKAGFTQGFALAHLPVRGTARQHPPTGARTDGPGDIGT
ncbi:MAG: phenylacetyl-CoA:acceptor oxidoreductase [Casimicrobiaceae bacterium]